MQSFALHVILIGNRSAGNDVAQVRHQDPHTIFRANRFLFHIIRARTHSLYVYIIIKYDARVIHSSAFFAGNDMRPLAWRTHCSTVCHVLFGVLSAFALLLVPRPNVSKDNCLFLSTACVIMSE